MIYDLIIMFSLTFQLMYSISSTKTEISFSSWPSSTWIKEFLTHIKQLVIAC